MHVHVASFMVDRMPMCTSYARVCTYSTHRCTSMHVYAHTVCSRARHRANERPRERRPAGLGPRERDEQEWTTTVGDADGGDGATTYWTTKR